MLQIDGLLVTAADVGRPVVYRAGDLVEQGVITGVNDFYVFVRYGSDVGSKATRAEDLEWVSRD